MRQLVEVRAQHELPRQRDVELGQHPEGEGVEHEGGGSAVRRAHRLDESPADVGVVESRADEHGVGGGELRTHRVAERVARGIRIAVDEREHAGFGDGDGHGQGDRGRRDERQPSRADAQGRDAGEHDRARRALRAADHHDPPAGVLGSAGCGERPLVQHPLVDPGGLTGA